MNDKKQLVDGIFTISTTTSGGIPVVAKWSQELDTDARELWDIDVGAEIMKDISEPVNPVVADSGSGGCIVDDVADTPDTFYTPLKGAKLDDVIKQANNHFNDVTKGLLFQIVATITPRANEPEGMGNRGVMETWIKVTQKKD